MWLSLVVHKNFLEAPENGDAHPGRATPFSQVAWPFRRSPEVPQRARLTATGQHNSWNVPNSNLLHTLMWEVVWKMENLAGNAPNMMIDDTAGSFGCI